MSKAKSSRIPSPARSQGGLLTPRRHRPLRRASSVGAPITPARLSSVVEQFKEQNMDSFALSPMDSKISILSDNTEIEQPRRKSWWKKLDDNSRDMQEVLEGNQLDANNVVMEYIDVEILSQERKNDTLDIPESSGSESIDSIVIPQRKLFTEKNVKPQKKFGKVIGSRESITKATKASAEENVKNIEAGTRNLFNKGTNSKHKPSFPAALLTLTPNKTLNKTKELTVPEEKGQVRSLFGNKAGAKRKNMFADFIVSESEDEIPDIQPKVFRFTNNSNELEMDDWNLLPSSTIVGNQLEDIPAVPVRESTGVYDDGTRNSSAEGSGWDSHKITAKTLRQTFGKDLTSRKSLRALVMQKSVKRQTAINEAITDLNVPDPKSMVVDDVPLQYDDDIQEETDHKVADHQVSHHDASAPKVSHHDASASKVSHHDASAPKVSHHDASAPKVSHHDASASKVSHHDASAPKLSHHDASAPKLSHHDASEHEVSDHGASDHQVSDHDASDHQVSDHDASDNEVSEHQKTDHVSHHEVSNQEVLDHQVSEKEVSDHKLSDHEVSDQKVSDKEVVEQEVLDHEMSDQQISEKEVSDHEMSDQPVSDQVSDHEVLELQISDNEVSDQKDSDHKVSDHQESEKEVSDLEVSEKVDSDQQNLDKEDLENEVSDNEVSDLEVSEHKVSDHQESDKEVSDQEDSEHEVSDHEVLDHQESEKEVSDDEVSEKEDSDHEVSEKEDSDHEVSEKEDSDLEVSVHQESEKEDSDLEVSVHQESEKEVTDQEDSDHEVLDNQVSDHQESDKEVSDQEDSDHQVSVQQESDKEVSDQEDSDHQVSDHQVTDQQESDKEASDQEDSDHGASDQQETDHEVSIRTRQTTLEMYLQKIKKANMEKRNKINEAVKASLSAPLKDVHVFKVPFKPALRRATTKPQRKPKTKPNPPTFFTNSLPKEVLEDMKYKPPKRFQPSNAPWITKRLYSFLESKLEPKYDYKARVRAEKLVETIYNFIKVAKRHEVAPLEAVHDLKTEMALLGIVRTHFEFFEFFHDFLPRAIRVKVNPDVVNNIPAPRNGIFSNILPESTARQ